MSLRGLSSLMLGLLASCSSQAPAPADPAASPADTSDRSDAELATPPNQAPPPAVDPWVTANLEFLRPGLRLGWPVETVHITSYFGWRINPITGTGTKLHRGLDLRGATGDLILSIGPGEVSFAGTDPLLGNLVIVDHGLGVTSFYGHMSDILVHSGLPVDRGSVLGLVGTTGRSEAPHLHITVKLGDYAVDPLWLIGAPLHNSPTLAAQVSEEY